VTSEVKEMVQANKSRASTKADDMSLQDMAAQLRDMPKQEEMMKIYQVHIQLLNQVIADITKARLKKLI